MLYHILPFGTLDLLAQQSTLHWVDSRNIFDGIKDMTMPSFVQNGKASCLYGATEAMSPALSDAKMSALAGCVPLGLVQDQPDACPANARKKRESFEHMPSNILGVDGNCGCHQGHRIVESSEKEVIGNLHAVHMTCSPLHKPNNESNEIHIMGPY